MILLRDTLFWATLFANVCCQVKIEPTRVPDVYGI